MGFNSGFKGLNTSSTAESALAFETTHEQKFPLPALQSVVTAAPKQKVSREMSTCSTTVQDLLPSCTGAFWTVHSVV